MDEIELQEHREQMLALRKRLMVTMATAGMLCVMIASVLASADSMTILARSTMAAFGFGMIGYVVGTVIAMANSMPPTSNEDSEDESGSGVVQVDGQNVEIVTCWVPVLDVRPGMRLSEDIPDPGTQEGAVLIPARTVLQPSDIERLKKMRVPTIPVAGLSFKQP